MKSTAKPASFTVLFDANSLMGQKTGVGYYTASLVENLAKIRPDVQFVGYYYNFLGRKAPPAVPRAANIRYRVIYHLPGPIVNMLRRFGIEVPVEILTLKRADFILYPNYLVQPSLFRTPSAPVIHDLVYYDHPDYGSDKSVRDLTRFVPRAIKRASFVLTVSDFTKQRLMDVYQLPAEKIVTTFIPPAPIRHILASEARQIITGQGITKPYILFVGTMEPRKNIPNLLHAYTSLPQDVRGAYSLVLAGKIDWKYQETKAKLEALQAEGYDIRYLGYVDDDTRAALYKSARLFVMAPHYEGFGMQTLESMQYGIQCAVSDIPVLHEAGGDAAAYFDQADPDSIAATVKDCLSRPAPSPQALQAYVASRPQWDQVAESVMQRIEHTLESGGKTT